MVISKYDLNEKPIRKDVKKSVKKNPFKWMLVLWVVVMILGVAYFTVMGINRWFETHEFKFHQLIAVQVHTPITIEKRKPVEILSPIVIDMLKARGDLTPIESKIVEKWGERYGYIALAIMRCESGLRADAVNWQTGDVGVAQINWKTWEKAIREKFSYTLVDMFDVDKNLEVAYWISDRDLDGKDVDFTPWVVFNTGAFKGCIK